MRVMLGLCVLAWPLVGACDALNPCNNRVTATADSPDGSKRLVAFVRDCGATVRFSSEVSLIDHGEEVENDGGNLLVIELPHGAKEMDVRLAWSADDAAVVTYPSKSEIFKKESKLDGVSVAYKPE